MNDIDQNMERVLRGLREAQPDASLEMRITQTLREAQPEPVGVSRFANWSLALRFAGAAGACAVLVAIVQHAPRERKTRDLATHVTSTLQSVATPPPPTVVGSSPSREKPPAHRTAPAVVEARTEADSTGKQQSFPAPPMPLTEQERLLIRLAHRDDPVQLARLGPGPRDDRYQAEKDQVSEFFRPPPPIVQPDTTLMESGGGTQ